MTKREEYAKAALIGYRAHPANESNQEAHIAAYCFGIADAMLKASGESQQIVLTDRERQAMNFMRSGKQKGLLYRVPINEIESLLGLAERIAEKEAA